MGELNKKESPRLKLGSKLLNQLGIKTILRNLMLGWQLATQKRANMEVAKYLVEAGEYQNIHEARRELDMRAQQWYEENKNA